MAKEVSEASGDETAIEAIDRLEEYTVVDCDVHEKHDPAAFLEYLDDPWRRRMRKICRSNEPLGYGTIGSAAYDWNTDTGGGKFPGKVGSGSKEGVAAYLDRMKSDYAVLHGDEFDFLSNIPEAEWAAEICTAYNEFMLKEYLGYQEGFKGVILVPPQAPKRGAEEIYRFADEDDFVSVHMPAGPNTLFGDPHYDPIYEAAADVGLPMDYHVGWTNPVSAIQGGPAPQSDAENFITFNHHMMSHLPNLIFEGVPERFPDLDHLFIEGGFTWLPHLMGKMDHSYERRRHDFPGLEMKPSEYVHRNFYFGTHPMEDVAGASELLDIFEIIDAENTLVYASDYPHGDFDYPSVLTIPAVDDRVEERIFSKNALELYDL